jgi:N-acyl-phosphatidylethanolamine-hydrolysing phospholipase D
VEAVQAVWVGHATVLVQLEGFSFITDPLLSMRCSPVQFAGPKRVVPAALQADDPHLPHLDFVLLSRRCCCCRGCRGLCTD